MAYEQILETLGELVEACTDGEADFLLCARHTDSEELREQFLARSARCRKSAHELQAQVVGYGGKGQPGGSASGALHRGWLRLRGALLGQNDASWLEECRRTEAILLSRYRAAMRSGTLPAPVRHVVEHQCHAWERIHGQVRSLRALTRVPM